MTVLHIWNKTIKVSQRITHLIELPAFCTPDLKNLETEPKSINKMRINEWKPYSNTKCAYRLLNMLNEPVIKIRALFLACNKKVNYDYVSIVSSSTSISDLFESLFDWVKTDTILLLRAYSDVPAQINCVYVNI